MLSWIKAFASSGVANAQMEEVERYVCSTFSTRVGIDQYLLWIGRQQSCAISLYEVDILPTVCNEENWLVRPKRKCCHGLKLLHHQVLLMHKWNPTTRVIAETFVSKKSSLFGALFHEGYCDAMFTEPCSSIEKPCLTSKRVNNVWSRLVTGWVP